MSSAETNKGRGNVNLKRGRFECCVSGGRDGEEPESKSGCCWIFKVMINLKINRILIYVITLKNILTTILKLELLWKLCSIALQKRTKRIPHLININKFQSLTFASVIADFKIFYLATATWCQVVKCNSICSFYGCLSISKEFIAG